MKNARRFAGAVAHDHTIVRRQSSVAELSVPVLVVGAGPVGLVLSILLSKLGIKSLVLEKRSNFLQHPQAHFINNRTMEPPIAQWRNFLYCTSLTGSLLGEVDHLHPQDLARSQSPTWVAHFSQHRLLTLLQLQAERVGMHISKDPSFNPNSVGEIKLGYECFAVKESINGVKALVSRTGSSAEDFWEINSSFLVGADGAASKIRKLLEIKMEGEETMQNLVSIHFFSGDLATYLLEKRPGMLYFIFNTKAIGVLVAHDLRVGEFVVQVPFYPPQQSFEGFTLDTCRAIICDLIGTTGMDIDIKAVKPWVMHAQVAESYFSTHKRIILAGDAAHRFPPAGGFGMNTGIQDAHNLAWKLGAVLEGVAARELLPTYESERKPVAKANTALSVENFKAAMSIPSVLGLDPSNARFVHQQLNEGIASLLPYRVQQNVLEGIFALGRMQVAPFILNSYNPIGSRRLQKLKGMLDKGQSLQLQFPAEDLGFRYYSGALVVDEETQLNEEDNYEPGRRNEYKPVCAAGARLPHMNITVFGADFKRLDGSVISTLDLVKGDAVRFLAFVGPNESGRLWGDSFLRAAATFQVMVKVVVVWPVGFSDFLSDSSKATSARLSANGRSLEHALQKWKGGGVPERVLHVEEVDKDWWELCKVSPLGAILVRPDDHVAWVTSKESSDNSIHHVQNIFAVVLQRKPM